MVSWTNDVTIMEHYESLVRVTEHELMVRRIIAEAMEDGKADSWVLVWLRRELARLAYNIRQPRRIPAPPSTVREWRFQ